MNFWDKYRITVGESRKTAFVNEIGVYQDGTTPMYRDKDGKLWAMSGHSHMGHIGMFCGTELTDMEERYPIQTNFSVGKAGEAFDGIRYPEGVLPRGSIWPFGLYICPNTHRFFCFFHNEGAWNSHGTGYDAWGSCDKPRVDSDFRHVGLMHSDDEGRTWDFDRWVLTGEQVCFTECYNPGAGIAVGQKAEIVSLGSGDFSMFEDGEYLYLFYNILRVDMPKEEWDGGDVYVARTRKRTDGVMGDFVKYYDGAFCEAGNLGKETPIARQSWHPRVVRLKEQGVYLMSSCHLRSHVAKGTVEDVMEIRIGTDLIHWSQPIRLEKDGRSFGNHYGAIIPKGADVSPFECGNEFYICLNHNGTDVVAWDGRLETTQDK